MKDRRGEALTCGNLFAAFQKKGDAKRTLTYGFRPNFAQVVFQSLGLTSSCLQVSESSCLNS